ncbi:hypothetical protein C8J56DRAFT_917433 [Mycena floridula]|nr:hypothetical protein C8J56DRAFT_917433 [Mycena floridula]
MSATSENPPQSSDQQTVHEPDISQNPPRSSDEPRERPKFPRISRPVELIRHEYDVVVIGSGYGGAVSASRMARGKQSVCVLEKGKERWPGEYPSALLETTAELHVSGTLTLRKRRPIELEDGDPTGLYHLILGDGQNVFVANGLGGTSLLNANVFLEADAKTLAMDYWPKEIRDDPSSLRKYYDLAASMLQPVPYPTTFPALHKLDALQQQSVSLGLQDKFYRVPQTTRFEDGPNSTGVEMKASTLTGMDCTGVNDGSKSSTLVNYLSDAWYWGAEIFCECEVRSIKKDPRGGYIIFYAWHGGERRRFGDIFYDNLLWVRAKKCVFLGAGSLATTEILLRSRETGLPMNECVGRNMSGNGDILAFGYNTDLNVNGIGRSNPSASLPVGPTITGVIDCRDQANPLDGFVIEEGAIPQALSRVLQPMLELMPHKTYPRPYSFDQRVRHWMASRKSALFGPYRSGGSIERTQTYLVMSHDSNQAVLSLKEDRPYLVFKGVGRSAHVKKLNELLARATQNIGGIHVDSPFFAAMGEQEITVHPIGGANLSSDGTGAEGATNHIGEVFVGEGSEVLDGLVCVDASVIPLALGVNPLATITALAERSVAGIAKKYDIHVDYETRNGLIDLFGGPKHTVAQVGDTSAAEALIRRAGHNKIQVTEVMEGFIHLGHDIEDFEVATNRARGAGSYARFFLTVHAWDTEALARGVSQRAMLTGTFTCAALSEDPLLVTRGSFELFNEDLRTPGTRNLTYDFDMISTRGIVFHFHGYKVVDASISFSIYDTGKAMTTLYTTLTDKSNTVIGRGILKVSPKTFVDELAMFQGSSFRSTIQFLSYFARQISKVFFAPFAPQQYPSLSTHGYLPKPVSTTFQVVASDGVTTVMHLWDPPNVSSMTPTVLLVPGALVDHQIFALPTISTNAIEYFLQQGCRLYVITTRIGKIPVALNGYTAFDARLDVHAALVQVRSRHENRKIHVVSHCVGSLAFSAGLLDGTIPAEWIRGITVSNLFMNPKFAVVNEAKARFGLTNMYKAVAGDWFDCASSKDDTLGQKAINEVLRLYPVGSRREICNSVVCHRTELIFGRLWCHHNLNEATHTSLANFFGGISMTMLSHLTHMGRQGHVCDNQNNNLVTPENVKRLAGIPILLFSGAENVVYDPESTEMSYDILRDQLQYDDYERVVFPGKGHLDCWMSADAINDVWPTVWGHIKKCAKVTRNADISA